MSDTISSENKEKVIKNIINSLKDSKCNTVYSQQKNTFVH